MVAEQKGIRYKLVKPDRKSVDESAGTVHAILSTENKDRDGDIIRQAYWDLESFLAHPVIIDSHEYRGLDNVIGEWSDVKAIPVLDAAGKQVKDAETGEDVTQLEATANYFVGENPKADYAFLLVGKGLGAYSVGFIPDFEKAEELDRRDPWGGYEFKGQELLEASQVTIPSNRESLQAMMGQRRARRIVDEGGDLTLSELEKVLESQSRLATLIDTIMTKSQAKFDLIDEELRALRPAPTYGQQFKAALRGAQEEAP